MVDEFVKEFDKTITAHSLSEKDAVKIINRKFLMNYSEVMSI